MGTILFLVVIGLVVGALARAVLPGRQALPIWLTMLIGAGALLVAGLVIPGERALLEIIVGVAVAAGVIALMQGGIRSRSTTRV